MAAFAPTAVAAEAVATSVAVDVADYLEGVKLMRCMVPPAAGTVLMALIPGLVGLSTTKSSTGLSNTKPTTGSRVDKKGIVVAGHTDNTHGNDAGATRRDEDFGDQLGNDGGDDNSGERGGEDRGSERGSGRGSERGRERGSDIGTDVSNEHDSVNPNRAYRLCCVLEVIDPSSSTSTSTSSSTLPSTSIPTVSTMSRSDGNACNTATHLNNHISKDDSNSISDCGMTIMVRLFDGIQVGTTDETEGKR
jgi:hypothetical protein